MSRDVAPRRVSRSNRTTMFAPAVAGAFALLAAACASTQKTDSTTATVPGTSAGGPAATANIPRHPPGQNPFIGAKWWDDPYSQAHLRTLRAKNKGDAETAQLMGKIAQYGGADWIGEWTPYVERWVDKRITLLSQNGALPYFVAYKIPKRDCGQYSAGGAAKGQDYKEWIDQFARAIGTRKAVIIVEPDALPSLKKCLSEPDQQERTALVRYAVHAFAQLPQTWVYLDAGHSSWIAAPEMAARLKAAGIDEADGFALNVSNYKPTDELMAYGKALSSLVGGKHFVIDTSRNGNGGPKVADNDSEAAWCNPAGRALGSPPTSETGEPLCDAFLWIKKPGESDGACNGGPKAGEFWPERAIELAKNAKW